MHSVYLFPNSSSLSDSLTKQMRVSRLLQPVHANSVCKLLQKMIGKVSCVIGKVFLKITAI